MNERVKTQCPEPLKRVFIVLNPVAGSCNAETVRQTIRQKCEAAGVGYAIYESTGNEQLPTVVREALSQGYQTIIAAGGDGTVSAVAKELVESDFTLGILPVGTANLLARELNIPFTLDAACDVTITGKQIRKIDVMKVGARISLSHISLGVYSRIAEKTSATAKRYFRPLAYIWNALPELLNQRHWRFTVTIDGKTLRTHASFIIVANVGEVGAVNLRWGSDIAPDDGQLDVCLVHARSLRDYLEFIWHVIRHRHKEAPKLTYLIAKQHIKIRTKQPVPVRGDGEIIGRSEVDIEVLPGALSVLVPDGSQSAQSA